ncbi:MAG: Methyl-accepting chemotaxis protein [uncultured Sulfurovum sp.]|uniref:histidine kinase n=1 Tax=uncultured Sulfurovum sp. TaxID=269237 RepID=A0A6S6U6F7_9BACT|nr:MAG: Methyl-accepting chemotaxis protein [uncultured Sulfurovum sp.]
MIIIFFFQNKTIASIHIFVMTMMFGLIVLFVSMVFFGEYNTFDDDAKIIQKRHIKNQKETIVFDTQRVLKFIEYMYNKRNISQDEEILKSQILNAIEQLYARPDGTGYIFIYDFNGVVLSDPVQTENIGKNLYNIEDSNGVKVIKDLITVSRQKDGGFVEYVWLKPTTGSLSPKVSYSQSFKPWGWMIGTGVYLDDIEKSIAKQRRALKTKLNKYMIDIIFLLSILFTFGMMGIILANNILKREIDTFTNFFQKASTSHLLIDKKEISLLEFKNMVSYINDMVAMIRKREETLTELNTSLETKVEAKTKDLNEKNKLLTKEKNFSNSLVEAQDSFIKHSIHEINTPLSVIMTHIDLFKLKEGDNRYLSKIEAASKIIANIYEDLSYMVKKDRFAYKKEMVNMSKFLLERIDFFYEIAKGNKHAIIPKIEQEMYVYMSPEKLQRIIDNNLSNAIKFANRGTSVEILLREKNSQIALSFITQSPKIRDTKAIFEAFNRENDVKGGFGLGLEIVHSICQKENIHIDLTSNDTQTIFTYTFKKES